MRTVRMAALWPSCNTPASPWRRALQRWRIKSGSGINGCKGVIGHAAAFPAVSSPAHCWYRFDWCGCRVFRADSRDCRQAHGDHGCGDPTSSREDHYGARCQVTAGSETWRGRAIAPFLLLVVEVRVVNLQPINKAMDSPQPFPPEPILRW